MYTNQFYRTGFSSAKATLQHLVEPLDDTSFFARPSEKKWCAGEVVSHLINTGNQYLRVLEEKFAEDTSHFPKGSGPFTHPFHLRLFIKMVGPDFKLKVPTLRPFEPIDVKELKKDDLIKEFLELQDRFLALVEKAEKSDLDLAKIKVGNPIYPAIKMSLSSCFAVTEAHQRRHFGQIERIVRAKT